MLTGNIFNIQRFCIHDGPGIRSTVFFKGCPLRCKWCANPESQTADRIIMYDRSVCIHCHSCEHVCRNNAISFGPDDNFMIDREKCKGCGDCASICKNYGKALSLNGETVTLDHVIFELLKDKVFYDSSDGGVTFSGGEVLMQIDFAEALAQELIKEKISIACETSGYAPEEDFLRLIQFADIILFDVKHYDDEKHFAGTGVHNELILSNLKNAIASGKKVIARIPIIPNFNDSLGDAENFGILLKNYGIEEANILPFHQFGQGKYEKLAYDYQYMDVQSIQKDDLVDYAKVLSKYVSKIKIGG